MKKSISLIMCSLLAGCTSMYDIGLAPAVQIPPLPENLAQKAEPLPPVEDATMGGLVQANVEASREYNAVSFQLNKLIDLYNCVQIAVNNKKEPECP